MSKIIKAAELKVLLTEDAQAVIPFIPTERADTAAFVKGETILEGANLLQDARAKAQELFEEAEREAQARLEQVQQEVDSIRLQAKEAGFAQGYRKVGGGRQKALEKAADLLKLLQSTVEEAVRLRAASLQALEDDFLKLSIFLADKVIRKEVETDISWLKPMVKEALEVLGSVEQVVVLLNPVDYALLQNYRQDLELSSRAELVFQQDASITPGGCLIETETGLIDARLERRLGKLAHHLLEVLYDEEHR